MPVRAAILALFVTAADAPPAPPLEQPLRVKVQMGQAFVCRSPAGCYVLNDPGFELVLKQVIEDVRVECSLRRIKS